MADDESTEDFDDEMDEENPKKGKRLILIIAVVLLLVAGAGAGLYFSGMIPMGGEHEEAAAEESDGEHAEGGEHGDGHGEAAKASGPTYYQMPEFIVNLNTGGRGTSFLKMKITLELPSEAMVLKVDAIQPRIVDSFNTYLRELRASDLSGSAGLYRLREEMLMRINKALHPDQVNDILFEEIIVQ